jgi:hypothetical protein
MPYVNKEPNLVDMFKDIETRLRRLESSKNLNVPTIVGNPPYPNNGDMWVNISSGANGTLYIYINNAIQTVKVL